MDPEANSGAMATTAVTPTVDTARHRPARDHSASAQPISSTQSVCPSSSEV